MGRPRGKPNAKPTKANIESYYRMLKTAAGKGDVTAMNGLIAASQRDELLVVQERERLNRDARAAKDTGDFSAHVHAIKNKLCFEIDQAQAAGKL
ncbi:hypothetical protein [Marinobacter changyiensis]|uniref:hypothetical protein n=1 Tax=Marinobacter changyiensis TaxID=2604091 RepID=UPI0012657A95|nr:hypothetical protein [Marinobacter changyiensis]